MANQLQPGDSCAFVIFGGMGDLTKRKLLPSLYNLRANGLLPKNVVIVGVARRPLDNKAYRDYANQVLREFATRPVEDAVWADYLERIHYVKGDFEDPATYQGIQQVLAHAAEVHGISQNVLFYLATPPDEFGKIVRGLGGAGLTDQEKGWRRVVIEKPFGRDLDSAVALNRELTTTLREDQIYRIDHYLGKETVQNLLVFRFANGIFEPVWNRRYVDSVQITVTEELGVEGRGDYFDHAGVLRDMVQSHIFQLLTLVAMEPPSSLSSEAVRNEKVKVLDAIRQMSPEDVIQRTVRGQYGDGEVGGNRVPAYRSEPKVAPRSQTETYAAMK